MIIRALILDSIILSVLVAELFNAAVLLGGG
jgi:hypothetical protein